MRPVKTPIITPTLEPRRKPTTTRLTLVHKSITKSPLSIHLAIPSTTSVGGGNKTMFEPSARAAISQMTKKNGIDITEKKI